LYSVAAIAKLLDVPESTLHYWKNRFDDVLPSVGRGRNKRFRAEALDIFRSIGRLLGQGLSCADVRAELARHYPVNVGPKDGTETAPAVPAVTESATDGALAVAARIGSEIASSLLAHLRQHLPAQPPASPAQAAEGLAGELAQVRQENAALTEKMQLLEAELVRLRKDRRELEAYLVDKINALRRPGEVS
jgi:DNA-binding transcriptional MerR regulator